MHGHHARRKGAGRKSDGRCFGVADSIYRIAYLNQTAIAYLDGRSVCRRRFQHGYIQIFIIAEYVADSGLRSVAQLNYARRAVLDNMVVRYNRSLVVNEKARAARNSLQIVYQNKHHARIDLFIYIRGCQFFLWFFWRCWLVIVVAAPASGQAKSTAHQ